MYKNVDLLYILDNFNVKNFNIQKIKEKTSKKAATASIVIGAVVPAVLFFTVGYDVFLGDPVFWGLFSSIAVLVIGSLFLKDKPEKENIAEA